MKNKENEKQNRKEKIMEYKKSKQTALTQRVSTNENKT
jgi:hypothetical protein